MTVDAEVPTRQRVVGLILHDGPQTARQLAERLDLTPAAIRRHLTGLIDDGVLTSREERVYGARGRGRPSKVFVLTDAGRAEFRQSYDALAIAALRRLSTVAGPGAVRELADEQIACIEERFLQFRDANPDRPAIEALVEALEVDGYAPSVRPVHSGNQLLQHHCPVAHVAAAFPVLCEVETQLFSRLLGSHVQRLATIAHGDGVCTTHVPTPLPTPNIPKRK
ncbi:Predicted transcriptional regulator, ArsR family [Tessaracoccus bendigoensis DSM 12906]|uniref:Predicted transcriptional regulator, ArsR family n=1 Tax=Tessaracoccus bendigoensis DSM 12906 TaxID=1123357 RepID=A0A1M6ICZ0_9ACTN|nr:metalloregulator ArsR/SmtB family transcription factor [Tessaracoccus bendigoensis]SHJ32277.1 Predicted transcriptional regulator, ArsR family [Tessaracoccus bendigoensis DSM 12906]